MDEKNVFAPESVQLPESEVATVPVPSRDAVLFLLRQFAATCPSPTLADEATRFANQLEVEE